MREKVGKSRNSVFPIRGSGGSKSRLAKAAGAEPAGQMRDEKVHAVVARSTFPSQNAQNTSVSDHFWKLRCRKKCTPLWREAHFEVKMYKTPQCRTTFGNSQQPTSPIGFLFLKLPPPPCAVLLVNQQSASLVHLESQVCCQTKHPNDIELRQVWNSCACWNLESLKASCSNVCFL